MNTLRGGMRALLGAALALMLLVTAVAFSTLAAIEHKVDTAFAAKDLTADVLPPPLFLVEMRLVMAQTFNGAMPVDEAQKEYTRLRDEFETSVRAWQARPGGELIAAAQLEEGRRFITTANTVLTALHHGDQAGATAAIAAAREAYVAHRTGVLKTAQTATQAATDAIAAYQQNVRAAFGLLAVATAVGAVLLGTLGWRLQRSIWRSTGGEPAVAAEAARQVAAGDLTRPVPVAATDHHSMLAAMESMRTQLRDMMRRIMQTADGLAANAAQMANANMDLSQRTEQQAGNLQQTASAMEQFSGTVQQTADAAKEAARLAQAASNAAMAGARTVNELVQTMGGIQTSSQRIDEITAVIDGIAFQTNILALNASVEAARAGEHGKGFAVVADEVRNLASRSAAAAKEIGGLIASSREGVAHGMSQAQHAGTSMDDIVQQVEKVTGLIGEISTATGEQTSGIGLVNASISQLDGATQQNTALVEETAASAADLRRQAEQLVEQVAHFKLTA